jgi:hypothetical protein
MCILFGIGRKLISQEATCKCVAGHLLLVCNYGSIRRISELYVLYFVEKERRKGKTGQIESCGIVIGQRRTVAGYLRNI